MVKTVFPVAFFGKTSLVLFPSKNKNSSVPVEKGVQERGEGGTKYFFGAYQHG
jgi:hypothetical protein